MLSDDRKARELNFEEPAVQYMSIKRLDENFVQKALLVSEI
jgi:hypothetical protein